MSKALVTGGAGFIGYHLCSRLVASGHQVDLLDDLSRGVRDRALETLIGRPELTVRVGDLRSPEAFRGLDTDYTHVFHLAAIIGVANVLDRPYAVLRDNLEMLNRMLDFCQGLGSLERFVFPSTSEVYAGTLQHFSLPIPTPETTPLALTDLSHPRTSYMLSKIYGEALCHQAGLPFTIIRPHNVYGPRMGLAHVVPELLQRAHRAEAGSALRVYSVDHRRTFCFVDDAVDQILGLAEAESATSGTFNIGSTDVETRIADLAELVVRVVGRRLTVEAAEETPGSPSRRCPDMTHTLAVVGSGSEVSLEEGVRRTYHWYRDHIFEGGDVSAS
ncbi:MAG: NAD-dependent epimerase/dehydratase family protein [Myxococcota bacterium]